MSRGKSSGRMETQVWHLVLIMVIMLSLIYHRSNMGIQDELAKLRLRQQLQMYHPAVKRARPVPIDTQMPSDNTTILSALAQPRDVVGVSHGTQATADTEREASLPQMSFGVLVHQRHWRPQHLRDGGLDIQTGFEQN